MLAVNERKKAIFELEKHALTQYQVATLYPQDLAYAHTKSLPSFVLSSSPFTNERHRRTWLAR